MLRTRAAPTAFQLRNSGLRPSDSPRSRKASGAALLRKPLGAPLPHPFGLGLAGALQLRGPRPSALRQSSLPKSLLRAPPSPARAGGSGASAGRISISPPEFDAIVNHLHVCARAGSECAGTCNRPYEDLWIETTTALLRAAGAVRASARRFRTAPPQAATGIRTAVPTASTPPMSATTALNSRVPAAVVTAPALRAG